MTAVVDVLHRLAARHQVPGAQLAVHSGGRTESVEYGELQHRSGPAVTGDACFPVGSISKLFTATLAMILVADGDLALDEPVRDLLDPAERARIAPDLTLRHLLSHTGGLPSGPAPAEVRATSPRRYLQDHCGGATLAPPGAFFSYSNLGYVLTGRLVEEVTGMGWQEAVTTILLAPLGIQARFLPENAAAVGAPPLATGHSVNPASGRTRPVRQSLVAAEAPAGALAVSATGLLSVGLLHLAPGRPRLLPPAYAAQMRAAVPGAEPYGLADGWGLGLAVYPGGVVGHDGNAYGTSCHLRVDATEGWAISLTTNANSGTAMWPVLLDELAALGIGPGSLLAGAAPLPTGPRPTPLVPSPRQPAEDTALTACVGRYLNGDTEYVVVDAAGGLWLSVDGDPYARVALHPDLTFELHDPETGRLVPGGRFLRAATGAVERVQLGGRLASRDPANTAARQLIA